MVRSWCFLICLIALAPGAAFAGSIPGSGFAAGGTMLADQSFAYNLDHDAFEPDAGLPGLSTGAAILNSQIIPSFQSFDGNLFLASPSDILGQGDGCSSSTAAGTPFCPQPVVRIGDNTVAFTTASVGYLTDEDPFGMNGTFAGGEPSRASLSSDVPSVVPEPGSVILFGTGILAIAAILGIRKL